MTGLLLAVSFCELLHAALIVPQARDGWDKDYTPGDFKLDPFKMASPKNIEAEIKNGRLAMMAISGIFTQDVLQNCGMVNFGTYCLDTAKSFPYMG
mmetsp:Transcript_8627/g.21073  ORF Transcript_8627/g.21073 Transcript_8627/m.21073 type:complete len:96 (+) Transcript_8627:3-290(+)